MRRIRTTLADDHPLVLNGLYHLLLEQPEFEVLDLCSSGAQVLFSVAERKPDLLVLDIKMPDIDGLSVVRQLKARGDSPKIVMLTAQLHEDEMVEALQLGVQGFVLKEMATKLFIQCLRRVHEGGQWIEKDAASRAMEKLLRRQARSREISQMLTPREIDVLRLVARGLTNREISEQLFIAEGTVKIHLHNMFDKLKVSRRTELVKVAADAGC